MSKIIQFMMITNGKYSSELTEGPELAIGTEFGFNWDDARGNASISKVGGRVRCTADNTGDFGLSFAVAGLSVGVNLIVRLEYINQTWVGDLRLKISTTLALDGASFFSSLTNPDDHTFLSPDTEVNMGFIGSGHGAGDYFDVEVASMKELS